GFSSIRCRLNRRRSTSESAQWGSKKSRKLTLCNDFVNIRRGRESKCGNSSVVEHNLAKVGVAGSNPVSRSICAWNGVLAAFSGETGGVAKWLRRRSAKPLCSGSNPLAASICVEQGALLKPGWRNWETQRT